MLKTTLLRSMSWKGELSGGYILLNKGQCLCVYVCLFSIEPLGLGHLIGRQSRSGRICSQCCSGAMVPHFQVEFIKWRSVLNRYFLSIVYDHRDRDNVWLSQHTWVITLNLRLNPHFKTSFESYQATPCHPG